MDSSVIRIYVVLGATATATNLPWIRGVPAVVTLGALHGNWVMILSIVAAAMTYYWDYTGRITADRLTIARAAAGLSVGLLASSWRTISGVPGLQPSIGFWLTVICASAAFGLLVAQRA